MVKPLLKLTESLRERNYRVALDLALQMHSRMPDNPYLLRLIADLYGILARMSTLGQEGWNLEEEAIRWGKRAVRVAPEIGWLWAALGWDSELHLDHEQACRAFRRALQCDSCCIEALRGLASLWDLPENEGERWITHEEAVACLKRIVELEHRDPGPAIHWLVRELRAMGRYEEARNYIIRALLHFHPPESNVVEEFVAILLEEKPDGRGP